MRKMIGIGLALLVATLLLAIIPGNVSAEGYECPECGESIEQGIDDCPTCGHEFDWDSHTLITDNGNNRVIEIDTNGLIIWQITVNDPFDAERLANGNTLIVERNYPNPSRVIEVEEDGTIRRETEDKTFRLSDYPATACVMKTSQPLVIQASDPDAEPAEVAYMRAQSKENFMPLVPPKFLEEVLA